MVTYCIVGLTWRSLDHSKSLNQH
uniref:Uncharacterized protein n=1 Tax=Rhizophora mucronata TaxID=61149 RepID=A0A2P2MV88_RHIMU